MKATLAMLACLSMVGFLTAAEVTGNNTAVVIQKNAVIANGGWQLICVPVNKLDITNADTSDQGIPLAEILPASLYAGTGAMVRIEGANKTFATHNGTDWVYQTSETTLLPGTPLWVYTEGKTSADIPSTVFCGQDRTRTTLTKGAAKSLTPMQNDSSVAISLYEVVADPAIGDEILVLANGEDDYVHYMFDKPFGSTKDPYWMKNDGTELTANDKIIAAGEAFFYYSNQ